MRATRIVPQGLGRRLRRVCERLGLRIERLRPSRLRCGSRFEYQRRFRDFLIQPGDRVLDVGSGDHPFPLATVLVDRFLTHTVHRVDPLATDGMPLLVADVHQLPFADKQFDFVYCSHLLEHVADPIRACAEIMRVGDRGYVETPTYAKDILFAWTGHSHKWHVCAIANSLVFFEYSQRQRAGIRSSAWRDVIFDRFHHPLQTVYDGNQDVFNSMLSWQGRFEVVVFRLDGSVERPGDARCSRSGAHHGGETAVPQEGRHAAA